MKMKTIEVNIIGNMVSIKTDDFSFCVDDHGGGVQGMNTAQEQALEPKYREMAMIAKEIVESGHSTFRELNTYRKR